MIARALALVLLAPAIAWAQAADAAAGVAAPSPVAGPERVLGLLALPGVFGNGPCHPFEPSSVSLFAAPGAASPFAAIEVDQHWSFAPHGGCEGLKVSVHGGGARSELPTREYANETPAAIVLAAQDGWFKIRLATGAAWLRASSRTRFMALADLFGEYPSLTAVSDAHSGPLRDNPDGGVLASTPVPPGTPVRVLDMRQRAGQTWLQVAVMSHSVCEGSAGPPAVVGLGWLPAHAASGEPTVWFAARGC